MLHETALIIRPGALGDTILTLPLLDSIRAQDADALVTFLGNRSCKDLFPPYVEFGAFDDPTWLWLFNTESEPVPEPPQAFDRAYVLVSRADAVVHNLRRAGCQSILQCPSRPRAGIHVVEHLHEALGLPIPARTPVLARLAPAERKDLIWVHPGSGGANKCLPLEIMYRLAGQLANATGWRLAVTAGEEDSFLERHPSWTQWIQSDAEIVMIRRPIREVCAELGSAKLFLGNDSGIAHLAAALAVPSVVFFVKSDPLNWAPWVPEDQMRVIDLRGEDVENLDLHGIQSRIESLLR